MDVGENPVGGIDVVFRGVLPDFGSDRVTIMTP